MTDLVERLRITADADWSEVSRPLVLREMRCALTDAAARIAELEAQLAQADAVVARNFPNAKPGTVQADTLACVERHRARQRMGTMFVGNTDAALADLRAALGPVSVLTTLGSCVVAHTDTDEEADALCDALSAILAG